MLLTRRLVGLGASAAEAMADGVCDYAKIGSTVIRSKTIVHAHPPAADATGGATLTSAIHESGHSFGLEHCQDTSCTMYPQTNALAGFQLYDTPTFCGDCAEELELASYLALAETLA